MGRRWLSAKRQETARHLAQWKVTDQSPWNDRTLDRSAVRFELLVSQRRLPAWSARSYGGLTFKYDDPNTLLIGGAAGSPVGHIYQIAVTRDGNGHITGFSGSATLYPGPNSTIGQYNDAGLAFGPANVLFVNAILPMSLNRARLVAWRLIR